MTWVSDTHGERKVVGGVWGEGEKTARSKERCRVGEGAMDDDDDVRGEPHTDGDCMAAPARRLLPLLRRWLGWLAGLGACLGDGWSLW